MVRSHSSVTFVDLITCLWKYVFGYMVKPLIHNQHFWGKRRAGAQHRGGDGKYRSGEVDEDMKP